MKSELTRKIGNRLRDARHARKWTLNELSLKTGSQLSKSRISNYEQGLRRPTLESAALLGEALDLSVAEIFFIDGLDPLNTHERALIARYRRLDTRGQRETLKAARMEAYANEPEIAPEIEYAQAA